MAAKPRISSNRSLTPVEAKPPVKAKVGRGQSLTSTGAGDIRRLWQLVQKIIGSQQNFVVDGDDAQRSRNSHRSDWDSFSVKHPVADLYVNKTGDKSVPIAAQIVEHGKPRHSKAIDQGHGVFSEIEAVMRGYERFCNAPSLQVMWTFEDGVQSLRWGGNLRLTGHDRAINDAAEFTRRLRIELMRSMDPETDTIIRSDEALQRLVNHKPDTPGGR
jgi:hypothetical protein